MDIISLTYEWYRHLKYCILIKYKKIQNELYTIENLHKPNVTEKNWIVSIL